jgi:hypothetical protein
VTLLTGGQPRAPNQGAGPYGCEAAITNLGMICWKGKSTIAFQVPGLAGDRAGELLVESKERGERHRGRGDQKTGSQAATPKLADLGITKTQSSRWQRLPSLNTPAISPVGPYSDLNCFRVSYQRLSALCLRLEPELDQPADGFGPRGMITLFCDPCIQGAQGDRLPADNNLHALAGWSRHSTLSC